MCSQLYSGEAEAQAEALLRAGAGEGSLDSGDYTLQGSEKGGAAAAAPRNPRSSVGAFTIFQLVQNGGSALWYLVSLRMPVHDGGAGLPPGSFSQVWIQVAFLVLVAATFVVVDRLNMPAARQ